MSAVWHWVKWFKEAEAGESALRANYGVFALVHWCHTYAGLMNLHVATIAWQQLNHGSCCVSLKALESQLLKSLASLRLVLVRCHEHWHNAHKRQGKEWPLSFSTIVISGDAFMSESVAYDDIWAHSFEPESKWKLMWLLLVTSPRKRNFRVCSQLEESWWHSFGIRKVFFLWASCLRGELWNHNCHVSTSNEPECLTLSYSSNRENVCSVATPWHC